MENQPESNWRSRWSSGSRWLERHSALPVIGLAAGAVFYAFVGVAIARWELLSASTGFSVVWRFANWMSVCFYESIQVLVLNMSPHETDANFFIGLARILAVLFFGLVVIQSIRKLFSQSFAELCLRFGTREISLIAGLGRLGQQIVLEELRKGRMVVVQEPNEHNPNRLTASQAGALVLSESIWDVECLQEHLQRNPTMIHLVTGSDVININALVNILEIRKSFIRSKKKPPGLCECYIHIENVPLFGSFNRCLLENSTESDNGLEIHPFNIYHETATQLIIDELTPLRPRTKKEVALYVVFGFEQMGMAMVKELVEFAHFENLKRSRILVISPDAERDYQKCISHWPRMCPREVHQDLKSVKFEPERDDWGNQTAQPEIDHGQIVDPKAVQYAANVQFCQLRSPGVLSFPEVEELVRLAKDDGACPVFLFCHEDDSTNFQMASELESLLQDNFGLNKKPLVEMESGSASSSVNQSATSLIFPIFTYLPGSRPLQSVLMDMLQAVRPFGDVQQGLSRAHDLRVENIAFEIAFDYHETSAENDGIQSQSRENFLKTHRSKPYWEKLSNLYAAEHKWILVQLLGFKMTENNCEDRNCNLDFAGMDVEFKKTLAKVEHNRWMAERLLINWSHGETNKHPPKRPSFCVDPHLSQDDWERDVNQIARTLELFQKQEFCFQRISPSPRSGN